MVDRCRGGLPGFAPCHGVGVSVGGGVVRSVRRILASRWVRCIRQLLVEVCGGGWVLVALERGTGRRWLWSRCGASEGGVRYSSDRR